MSDHRPFEPSGRLVLVFTAPNIPAGVVARSVLEAEGIPVMVKGESEGPYRVGPVYLLVPEEHEDEARRILEEVEREGAEVDPDL
jgi:hypothetical protein